MVPEPRIDKDYSLAYCFSMATWVCEQCGDSFERDREGVRPIRFCSQSCYHAWRAEAGSTGGQFPKGNTPWNKGIKGIRLNPATEFKPGPRPEKQCAIGEIRFRKRRRDGKLRAFVKVAQPNVWRLRAHIVWEEYYGKIPTGCIIHHKDRDTTNDAPNNLVAKLRSSHINEHRKELEAGRKSKKEKNK